MEVVFKEKVDRSIIEKISDKKVKNILLGKEAPPNAVLKRKLMTIQPSRVNMALPRMTASLCPECGKVIPAKIFEKDGKVMIKKKCPEHGEFEDIYYSDVELFLKNHMFALDGVHVENYQTKLKSGCPYDCGLCNLHYSHPGIVNLDLTNRCNMRCPICFANANAAGYVYEPSYEEVINMLRLLRNLRPVPAEAVQFAGGEPTIYPRFLDVVRYAKKVLNFPQVQVATNGIRIAAEPDFAQKMRDVGMDTIYLQFDGFKEETYVKARGRPGFLKEKLIAIERLRHVKPGPLATVLVPVIVRGVNDDEVGKIIYFALENLDVIRSVNYQPVSFSGRIDVEERIKGRYTMADLIHDAVNQTDFLTKDDFIPVPAAAAVSELVSGLKKDPKVSFTCHPMCGIGTYVIRSKKGTYMGISKFVDVWGLYKDALEIAQSLEGSFAQRMRIAIRSLKITQYFDEKYAPPELKLRKMIRNIILKGTKQALGDLHWRVLFIGAMHFMDRFNYDVERVQRCVVHYVTPDGRLIPFCAYNTGGTLRREIESKFSMTFEEYRKKYGAHVEI